MVKIEYQTSNENYVNPSTKVGKKSKRILNKISHCGYC